MLIGVVSDSHDNVDKLSQAVEILNDKGVDVVFHLGDIISPFTLRVLGGLEAEVHVLYGNNDGDKLLLAHVAKENGLNIHEQPFTIEIDNYKVIAIHGWGSKENTKYIVDSFAHSGRYNIILYGHTHEVDIRKTGNVLVVNPGELHGYLSRRSTIAVIDLKKFGVEVIEL